MVGRIRGEPAGCSGRFSICARRIGKGSGPRRRREALPHASPLSSRPPRQAPRPARRAAPRVAPPARARAAPARPDRPRPDRARRLLRFLVYGGMDGGRAGDWTVDSLRWLLGAVHYGVPAALLAAGAILVLRPVLPGGAPVPRGRDLPVRRALPRPRGRHARPRPRRRAPRLLGSRVGAHARRHGRRGALLGQLDAARRRRRAHPRRLPVPRGRAAAHGRVRRGRREGDRRLHHARGPDRRRGRRPPPRRRGGAARPRDARARA